ncbi:unnamed protein product, partial [Staurois parvus]
MIERGQRMMMYTVRRSHQLSAESIAVTNHASLSGNPMDMSGFGSCQENGTCLTA